MRGAGIVKSNLCRNPFGAASAVDTSLPNYATDGEAFMEWIIA